MTDDNPPPSSSLLEQRTSTLRHDLRNHLSVILNASFYLQRKVSATPLWESEPRVERFFSIITEELAKLDGSITNDLTASALTGPPAPAEGSGAQQRLLLVEDDDANRMTLSALLDDEGYTVDEAIDVQSATVLLNEHQYDAAVLDWNLGATTSEGLVAPIRASHPNARIVVLSGGTESLDRTLPVDAVLSKGEAFSRLLALITG